jgi:alanine-glyoxylate transaminase/serine-glyoxylate transaminase/serine-pyruvate transaminase
MAHIDPRKLPELPALMIAGPGELHEEDLDVMGHQTVAHYGDLWTQLHGETIEAIGEVLGAREPYLVPGTGTTCLDAAVFNLFEPGQKVVVANTGFFGARLAEIASQHKLDVVEIAVEVGAPIDPEAVRAAAQEADGVLTVHVETATGVRHPIAEIAQAAHSAGAVYLVDGIASAGGEIVDVEGMGLDAFVTGTQKGLEAPPGLGILALSDAGRERVARRGSRPESWYLDLAVWDRYRSEWGSWHPHPVTMPTALVLALASSLRRIQEAGLDSWVEARAVLATKLRNGLKEIGLDPVPQEGYEANLVVAVWADEPASIQRYLAEEKGIMVSGGLTPTLGKAIRVGLMGRTATDEMAERVIDGVREALEVLPRAPESPPA